MSMCTELKGTEQVRVELANDVIVFIMRSSYYEPPSVKPLREKQHGPRFPEYPHVYRTSTSRGRILYTTPTDEHGKKRRIGRTVGKFVSVKSEMTIANELEDMFIALDVPLVMIDVGPSSSGEALSVCEPVSTDGVATVATEGNDVMDTSIES